jgi:hypothetical protein
MVSDQNRDNILQTDEYVVFLNKESEGAFEGTLFGSLPLPLQLLFFTARGTNNGPSIFGSKPGQQATSSETASLQQFCSNVMQLYMEHWEQTTFVPTMAPGPRAIQRFITEPELSQCKLFLFVSDGNQNSLLSQEEFVSFVNRLTINEFLGQPFLELPLLIQDVFVVTSGANGQVSIAGAQPQQEPTAEESAALESFCEAAYGAVEAWDSLRTNEPTVSPTQGVTNPPPTVAPISVANFPLCRSSMVISDQDQNRFLNQNEFVIFLNQMSSNLFLDLTFQTLELTLRILFFSLRDVTGSISILGASPSEQQTDDQTLWLRRVCAETEEVLMQFMTPTPTVSPTQFGMTLFPVQDPPMTQTEFARCKVFLNLADTDKNKILDATEYVTFLNRLFGNAFLGLQFIQLDEIFKESFELSESIDGTVSTIGSTPADNATPSQVASISFFCSSVYNAYDIYLAPPTPPLYNRLAPLDDPMVQECIETMVEVDLDANRKINQVEYAQFMNDVSNITLVQDIQFLSLPYVAQENFLWVSDDSLAIDMRGVDNLDDLNGTVQLLQLAQICKQSLEVVFSEAFLDNETELLPHCYNSYSKGDQDGDGLLGREEFVQSIGYFLGQSVEGVSFDSLYDPFQLFFIDNSDSNGSLNIQGSQPSDIPDPTEEFLLNFYCSQMASAVTEVQAIYSITTQCSHALVLANTNEDEYLSADEYTGFVLLFAGRQDGSSIPLAELPLPLLENFIALKVNETGSIPIEGWREVPTFLGDGSNLDAICMTTYTLLPSLLSSETPTQSPGPGGDPTTATVFNGFIIEILNNTLLPDVSLSDIPELELAYKAFVNETIIPLLPVGNLRGQRLNTAKLLFDSPTVYQLDEGTCPDTDSSGNSTRKCMEAYASFDLVLSPPEGIDSVVSELTLSTQQSIANGRLQVQLEQLGQGQSFFVVGVTGNVRPVTQIPTEKPSESLPSASDSFPIAVILIPLGGIILCTGLWFFCKRQKMIPSIDMQNFLGKAKSGMTNDSKSANDANKDNHSLSADSSNSESYEDESGTPLPEHVNRKSEMVPAASEHSRADARFNFAVDEGDMSDWRDEEQAGNAWTDTGKTLLTGDDSQGSDESELVVRASSNLSVENSRASRQSGEKSKHRTSLDESESSQDASFDGNTFGQEPTDFDNEGLFQDYEDDYDNEGSYGDDDSLYMDSSGEDPVETQPPSNREMHTGNSDYREQIEALVLQVVPDELGNVDAMMGQFAGREEELIKTLSKMARQIQSGSVLGQPSSHSAEESSHTQSDAEYDDEGFEDDSSFGDDFGEEFYDEAEYDE